MLSIRLHLVMGHAAASLWCSSHGPDHCLWSARQWVECDDPVALLGYLRDAAQEAASRATHGALEDLTDECGR